MNCDSNLQDYLDTLNVSCQGNESEAAILTWTPDENTPDVVYYQVRIDLDNGDRNFTWYYQHYIQAVLKE